MFFGAGCNSLPAVTVRDLRKQLIWCNSKTDSKVWMKEEVMSFSLLSPKADFARGFF